MNKTTLAFAGFLACSVMGSACGNVEALDAGVAEDGGTTDAAGGGSDNEPSDAGAADTSDGANQVASSTAVF
jgi:hypothetical protein